MIDPVQALGSLTAEVKKATSTTSYSPTSFPTVVPDYHEEYAHGTGHRTLWVVFVIMTISTAIFSGMAWRVPISKRLYHFVTTLIVMTAALSYFAMATGGGWSWHTIHVVVKNKGSIPDVVYDIKRQVYWARYVDWLITTPLLLLDLSLVAGLSGAHIMMAIVADIVMVATGLFAAYGNEGTPQKWGWYAIACIAYLVIVWHLAVHGRARALARGGKVAGFFGSIALFTFVLWTAYPIVWGIADGARKVSVDGEIVAYAVLDVLAKPVFGLWLLLTHAYLPESNADVGGFWTHGLSAEGTIRIGDDDGA